MSDIKTLYDEDFFAWTKEQAEVLRSAARGGSNRKLDWENLAEEIESLGKSDRRELGSQIRRIIQHLLKLQYSLASIPRAGWIQSISDARVEIDALIEQSPSLAGEVEKLSGAEHRRGSRKAITDLGQHSELDTTLAARIRATTYTPEQILDEDWFPPEPQG
jgi:hypothetical protein